jgi:hypothetical protein
VVDSRAALPSKGSNSSQSSGLMPRVSQIHLNYDRVQDQLRATQDKLATEREDNTATRDSWATYNAHMQMFMLVRNKNTFVAFLSISDMYVC